MRRSQRKKGYHPTNCHAYDKADFEVFYVDQTTGRGVKTLKNIHKGDFVLFYEGKLLSACAGDDTYVFEFSIEGKTYWIDATEEDGSLGRLLNDDMAPNLKPKAFLHNGQPTIGFFALRNIFSGEELRYFYGRGQHYPWRIQKSSVGNDPSWSEPPVVPKTIRIKEVVDGAAKDDGQGESDTNHEEVTRDVSDVIASANNVLSRDAPGDGTMQPIPEIIEDSCDSTVSEIVPYYGSLLQTLDPRTMSSLKTLPESHSSDTNEEVEMDTYTAGESDQEYSPSEEPSSESEDNETEDTLLAPGEKNDISQGNKLQRDKLFYKETLSLTVQNKKIENEESKISSNLNQTPEMLISKENLKTQNDGDAKINSNANQGVSVMTTNNLKSQRIWDKKHCCVFCMNLYAKLPRHLEQMHPTEIDVAKALSYPKQSEIRRNLLAEIRNKGDFAHNREVLQQSNGVLIPWKRPTNIVKPSDYLPCENCFALFIKSDLWKHKKNCKQTKEKQIKTDRPRRGTHQVSGAALLPVSQEAQSQMRSNILDKMANDEISLVARNDDLIVKFGVKLYSKTGQEKHSHQYIKQKLREIARFLIVVRKRCDEVQTLTDCINPVHFPHAVESVKELCNYQSDVGIYGIPSLALKLGHTLKKCAKYLRSSALQIQDGLLKQHAEEFRELMENDWTSDISAQALATLHKGTFNKPQRLPIAKDLKKLNLYLSSSAEKLVDILQRNPAETVWKQLAEVTLAQVVLFNRRRGGETERMPLQLYYAGIQQGEGRVMQEEVAKTLSPFERSLAAKLNRVEIRGKRGRKVPVLLTKAYKNQIDILNQNRAACGVCETNEYLFARSGQAKTPLRTCDALRKFTNECGAEKPEWITSTSLRKHVATVSQLLNLKGNELDVLAGFMGHDIRIHREYYRLPDDTLQLAKVSKVLLELERGNLQKYKGKSLDDIQIEEDELINDEECEPADHSDSLANLQGSEGENDEETENDKNQNENQVKATYKQKSKEKGERRPWNSEEKAAVKRQMGKFFRIGKVPGKADCEKAIALEPALHRRPWTQIKFFIKNSLTSKKSRSDFSSSISALT